MTLNFDTSAEDIKVFLDEAEEMLQLMESEILNLEKEAGNSEHLSAIFRAAHTLKGSSATLGHRQMAEVTHSMENVLDKLRKGKLVLTTTVVDTLFACLDVLKSFKQEIASGLSAGIETGEILSLLSELERSGAVEASAEGGGPASPTAHRLGPEEEKRLRAGISGGLQPYWIKLQIDPASAMPAVRAFQVLLIAGELGDLIRSWPDQEEVEDDRVGGEITLLLLSSQEPGRVRSALAGIPDISLTECRLYANKEAPEPPTPTAPTAVEPTSARTQPGAQSVRSNSRTVRVDVEVLDNLMSLVGELVIDRTRLLQVLTQLEAQRDGDELTQVMSGALAHIGRMTSDLQEEIQRARMLPVDNLFKKFPRMVRDTSQKAGKEIDFVVLGEETELDRSVIEEIGDPLMHLLRNSVDHGIEPPDERVRAGKPARGKMVLEAFHEENQIIISVRDDGRGIDPAKVRASAVRKGVLTEEAARRLTDQEAINLIWAAGFSTAEIVSDISGRGVGLDVVLKNIEKLNGSVDVRTEVGVGTEFRVKLPLTLAIIRSLQVRVRDTTYCIPLASVVETDRISVGQIQTVRQREVIVKRGEVLPLLRLDDAFRLEPKGGQERTEELFVVIVYVFGRQVGIVVDNLVGEGDVVIKPLGKLIGDVPGISGATIMGDGDVAIILDISSLVNAVQAEMNLALNA